MRKEEAAHAAYVLRNLRNHVEGVMRESGGRSFALAAVDDEDLRCLEYAVNLLEETAEEGET